MKTVRSSLTNWPRSQSRRPDDRFPLWRSIRSPARWIREGHVL